MAQWIEVRNPHSVIAALEKRPHDVKYVIPGQGDAWQKVAAFAKKKNVQIKTPDPHGDERGSSSKKRQGKNQRPPKKEKRLGHGSAEILEHQDTPLVKIIANASDRSEGKGLWLALDCVQDPQNLGAIFRTAAFFSVQGIVMTVDRSASMTGTVYDVACGGVEAVPFQRVTNLSRALQEAKDAGIWILGSSEHGHQSLSQTESDRPWMLVLGNEEKGMRRLTSEACDVICTIPPQGTGVTSLNVAAASSILIAKLSGI